MKTYAVSDLHGCLDLYKQIKDFIQPEDKVYFLGDAGDRGPQSWETIKAIYEDPQFIYLKGNHEDMLVKTMRKFLNDPMHGFGHDLQILAHNGGRQTFDGWRHEPEADQTEWYHRLMRLPRMEKYENKDGKTIYLSHAGFDPDVEESWRDYLWDRDHIYNAWEAGVDEIVVHGHTPFVYMVDAYGIEQPQCEEMPEDEPIHAAWYSEHHKVCIDCGAFFTGQTLLLDLDTFEEHYFYTKEE
jgi:serine/threonine protein phosphatase 1